MGAVGKIALAMCLFHLANCCKNYCLKYHFDMGENDLMVVTAVELLITELLEASHYDANIQNQPNHNQTNSSMKNVLLLHVCDMGICHPPPST